MSDCIDRDLGRLLHAYELGQLEPDDQDRFELHLLACDHCHGEVSRFTEVARLMRTDADVQRLVRTAAVGTAERESIWARIAGSLWPRGNLLLRPALTYLLLILLAYPAYVGIRHLGREPVRGVQSLLLTGTRTLGDNTAAAGEPLVLMFRIDGARPGETYYVAVHAEDGQLVYENFDFADFNKREMATLLLPAGSVAPGRYQIEVRAPGQDRPLHQYTFIVE